MKREQTVFECDNCKGTITRRKDDGFPYDMGWIYLHKLNFKMTDDIVVKKNELHFCSKKCFEEYMHNLLVLKIKDK